MSHFVTVFDKEKYLKDGAQSEHIVDWGEYSGSQQAANLAVELLSRWTWDTPIHIEHRTERGGGSAGCVFNVMDYAKEDCSIKWDTSKGQGDKAVPILDSGVWKKEPKWKGPEKKGLIFLGGFQQSPYVKMNAKTFKSYTGVDKNSPEAQRYLRPMPIQYEFAHFGCRRNKQTKDHAKELLIRYRGPGESYDLNEIKMRMFGRVDDDPYSTSRNSSKGAEPRPYWKIHTYEMAVDGTLTHESVDLLQACIDFYGTDDLMKMKAQNSWAVHKAVMGTK